ncbi:MAG: hypothetical protein ACHQ2Z_07510 [Elusimicrobiota bacterium]
MPITLAELILLAAAVWLVYRLLEPLRRRLERFFLRLIDPSKKIIIDAEIVSRDDKKPKE